MSINARIKELRKSLGYSQEEFSTIINVSRSVISQVEIEKQNASIDLLIKISNTFHIDYKYLLEGVTDQMVSEDQVTYFSTKGKSNLLENQAIPLYDIEAVAGLVPLFDNSRLKTIKDHIYIPYLPKCDGAVFVTGDSMYPILKSGDIVCYKVVNDKFNDLFWGNMYLLSIMVSGEEYISVKYIQKSDLGSDYVRLVSQNQHHQDKDVSLKSIHAIALVKATIRINNM